MPCALAQCIADPLGSSGPSIRALLTAKVWGSQFINLFIMIALSVFVEPTGGEGRLRDPFGVRPGVRP